MSAEYANKKAVELIASSSNQFSLDLYQALSKTTNGNLFFSPFSISTVLAMVHIGTKEKTKDELRNVLHFPTDKDILKSGYKDVIEDYRKSSPWYELNTSNMIYISNILPVLDEFRTAMTKDFLSESKIVDFEFHQSVRKEINDRVEKETNSRIKDIIPEDVLNSLTRMVLVNAIHFKGLWHHEFNPNDTEERKFWITGDQSKKTSMMFVKESFSVTSLDGFGIDARSLSMGYEGDRLTMIILLPNKRDGLAEMEKKLSTIDFNSVVNCCGYSEKVKVIIPKFKLEETVDLVDTLKKMGVNDLFNDSEANLSGISTTDGLYVSNVLHKAYLEVDEKGSEAAAATAMRMVLCCGSISTRVVEPFIADHPFMFFIQENRSRFILFAGKFVRPS